MTKRIIPGMLLLAAGISGCEFHARSPEDYQAATRALLESRSSQIKSCYDNVLKSDKKAAGTVVVKFTVMEETGAITDAQVAEGTTASPAVGQCIVTALDGLALDPPDERKGDATFVWEFVAG
jgi:hypothetical protein